MASVQNIEQWNSSSIHFESGNYDQALQGFLQIADSSKILFNIGVIHQVLENHTAAISAFNKAVKKDPYFSVAYFLRGISLQLLARHEDAIHSFCDALDYMRGNDMIDYTQLGLAYQLYSCEIYYNCALTYAQVGNTALATSMLENAVKCKQLPDHDIIDEAMKTRGQGFELFQLPPNLIFKPPASKVEGLKKIDFSGSAKVIAALNPDDNFVEFKGFRSLGLDKKPSGAFSDLNELKDTESMLKSKTATFRPRSSSTPSTSSTSSSSLPRRPSTPNTSRISNASILSERSASLSVRSSKSSNYTPEKPPRPVRPPLSPISPIQENPRKPSLTVRPTRPRSPPLSLESTSPSPANSDSSFRTSDKIRVKVNFEDKRLIMLPSNVTFKQLYYKIQEKYDADQFRIFYKDEAGEWMGLSDDDDLATALELSPESGKLEIWCT